MSVSNEPDLMVDSTDRDRERPILVTTRGFNRLGTFHALLGRTSPGLRANRMAAFSSLFDLKPGTRILDLGGATGIWRSVAGPLDITIINLPGFPVVEDSGSQHNFTFMDGDATSLPQLADDSFDIVFSNSVIEHVGGPAKQADFAREARRLAPGYFVQTPSIWFPLEAHTGLPFWWFLPRPVREILHRRWRRTLPDWNEMIEGTTVLKAGAMRRFFPDGTLRTERFLGVPKAYFVYRQRRQ